MPRIKFVCCFCALTLFAENHFALADVPQTINHQGVVSVNGSAFNGNGSFRFAIVDRPTGLNLWTNDGTNLTVAGVPTAAVSLSVANGVYSVRLGDSGLPNMTPVPSAVFNNPDTALRIWFNDGVNGNQQLSPDYVLTPSPYSHRTAIEPPIGSIVAWHNALVPGAPVDPPSGWVRCDGPQPIDDPSTPINETQIPDLNNTPPGYPGGGRFLRGGASSGDVQVDDLKSHRHDNTQLITHRAGGGNNTVGNGDLPGILDINIVSPTAYTGGGETRPINMTVVWIIRVK